MRSIVAILDCYTVEPSGLGVPPFLSTYVRTAYAALCVAHPGADVRYLTIDDVRWCLNDGKPYTELPLSDPLTYSATASRDRAIKILTDAEVTVVIAGDAVPSVHLPICKHEMALWKRSCRHSPAAGVGEFCWGHSPRT
jgi:radical SAM superfamily enzyme with C-terminal helix-hairpin-helix motif